MIAGSARRPASGQKSHSGNKRTPATPDQKYHLNRWPVLAMAPIRRHVRGFVVKRSKSHPTVFFYAYTNI
jgi:hypothetical protein